MEKLNDPAGQFRAIAASIRNAPHDRLAIAAGFDLIASCIEQAVMEIEGLPLDVIDPLDLPDLGREINADMSQAA